MEEFFKNARKKERFLKKVIIIYYIISGVFVFPPQVEQGRFTFEYIFMGLFGYGVLALLTYAISNKNFFKSTVKALLNTIIGMGLRYLIEYREVSNTYNFTMVNIIAFLSFVVLYTAAIFIILNKLYKAQVKQG